MEPTHHPLLGQLVIYRSRDGIDLPAVITAVIDAGAGDVHLEIFAPPHARKDILDPAWGAPRAAGGAVPPPGTWRTRDPSPSLDAGGDPEQAADDPGA